MFIFDAHTHAFPDFLAKEAVEKLSKQAHGEFTPYTDGTVNSLLKEMDRCGVDKAAVCCIATRPAQTRSIIIWCGKIRSDRIIPVPSVHPDNRDIEGLIQEIKESGFPAVKLHPQYQGYCADSQQFRRICKACSREGVGVVIHAGYDIGFPNNRSAHPRRIKKIIERFPALHIMATHLGGWNAWESVEQYLAGEDIWFETSFVPGFIPQELFTKIFKKHNPSRICFGTDSPWRLHDKELTKLKTLPIPKKTLPKILGRNAEQFFTFPIV